MDQTKPAAGGLGNNGARRSSQSMDQPKVLDDAPDASGPSRHRGPLSKNSSGRASTPRPEPRSAFPSPLTQQPEPGHYAEREPAQPHHGRQPPVRSGSSSPPGPRPDALLASPLMHPNGASMFPSMSTSEQEDMAREALSQAEASIVADTLDDVVRNDELDGGYSSDGFSSGTTSAESSVRDYLYENGRRYHRFREGTYNFPNDDVEQEVGSSTTPPLAPLSDCRPARGHEACHGEAALQSEAPLCPHRRQPARGSRHWNRHRHLGHRE